MNSFIKSFFEKPKKDILPLWVDTNKIQPLREVIVIKDVNVQFYPQIRVTSSSSYPTK
jgi:hypothetical protein